MFSLCGQQRGIEYGRTTSEGVDTMVKDTIIDQSMSLFEKHGFRETSVQDICDALGVTKGAFYYYFPSKEALLMEIHERYIDGLLRQQSALLLEDVPSKDKLLHTIELLLDSIHRDRASARIFFAELRELGPQGLETINKKRHLFRTRIEALVEQAVAEGSFRPSLDAKIATMGILGMVNWSYQWFQPDGRCSSKEVAAIFHQMVMLGMEIPPTS